MSETLPFVVQLQVGVDVDGVVTYYQTRAIEAAVFLVVLVAVYLLGRSLVVPPLVRAVRSRNPDNPTLVDAVEQYLRLVFLVVGVPIATTAAGFGSVVAGSAVVVAAATLALGVAGQDVIGNFVSGVFLVADPDFNVDDYIEWGDRGGTVEDIDLRVTRVRTVSGEVVVVPNTDLATSAVVRPYARDRYRVTEHLLVAYDEDVESLSETIVSAVREDDRVRAEPSPDVHVADLGPSALELAVNFWVGDPARTNVAAVRTDAMTRVKDRLLDAGVTVAPASQQEVSGGLDVQVADGGSE